MVAYFHPQNPSFGVFIWFGMIENSTTNNYVKCTLCTVRDTNYLVFQYCFLKWLKNLFLETNLIRILNKYITYYFVIETRNARPQIIYFGSPRLCFGTFQNRKKRFRFPNYFGYCWGVANNPMIVRIRSFCRFFCIFGQILLYFLGKTGLFIVLKSVDRQLIFLKRLKWLFILKQRWFKLLWWIWHVW